MEMISRFHFLRLISYLLLILQTISVKFDLQSTYEGKELCLSQYMAKDTFVSVKIIISPGAFQNVDINVVDKSPSSNLFHAEKNLKSEVKFAFTTHEWNDVEFWAPYGQNQFKSINFHVDTGAEATDFAEQKKKEKLTVLELELIRLENLAQDLSNELDYLHKAEFKMRDINGNFCA
ncbi:vesicle coat component [Clydaea vesicula]|uniref:Vesicle coat component n=1 Tax=Clydaea vesicula TaxID=447962 RepID=A0AAD5XY89_9FUNG|nr:vesicle coat component [Clydaea vesicula]